MIAATPLTVNTSSDNIKLSGKNESWFPLTRLKELGLAIFILFVHATAYTQHDTTQKIPVIDSLKTHYDSATNKIINSFKQFGIDEERKNIIEYNEDTIATKQDEIIEEIRRISLEAKSYLKSGLDTTGLAAELKKLENWYDIAGDGVFTNRGTIQTNRNLETSYTILKELLARTVARKSSLDDYYKNLVAFRNDIDSLNRVSVLYRFSSDSAVLIRYVKKLIVLSQEVRPTDSAFKKTLTYVSELQTIVNSFVNRLNSTIEQVQVFQKELSAKAFNRQLPGLGAPAASHRPFREIISFSEIKGVLALVFYIRNNIGSITLVLILLSLATIFLANLKRNLRSQDLLKHDMHGQLVLRYPFLSALVVVLNLLQFTFTDPPFVFIGLLWTISAISLTFIFRNFITRYWVVSWLIMFVLFLLAGANNLILQASKTERWIMMALSVTGLLSGSIMVLAGRRKELKEKWTVYFIGFLVIMQIVSIVANIYGRYNLSKTCLVAGYINVVIAILFFWTVRFINEVLSLANVVYRISDKTSFDINLERAESKTPPILYVLLIIGWFVLFARNFYIHRLIADPIRSFIQEKRTVGDFSFTIGSMLEFFLILFLSGLISQVVSFFASNRFTETSNKKGKKGIGSWLLIIRISIISIGLLLAFAAAGIPMDRVTIIVSALSVGIGFGLQTLVNNLVSGLIISFEKPVNIGDIIEIGGQSGTVKSIGFRSSIISIPNGSDMVIPNGDLLNQRLVNWTHGNTFRCVDIATSVAYGTDLAKAIQILKDLPAKDERIRSSPAPGVIIQNFTSNAINMQLSFWVENLREWIAVKSDIILAMDIAFKENGIEIPVPQQDVRILSVTKEEDNNRNESENKDKPEISKTS